MAILGYDPRYTIRFSEELEARPIGPEPERNLFGRIVEITSGGKTWTLDDLDIEFKHNFDYENDSSECEITIYNLSDDSIAALKRNGEITVDAGYRKEHGVLFEGRISDIETTRSNADKKTVIYCLDAADLQNNIKVSSSYKKNTKASTIIRDQANFAGIAIGKIQITTDYAHKKAVNVTKKPMAAIFEQAKLCGASAYIDHQKLYVVDGDYSKDINFVLSAKTGLISSPERFELKETTKEQTVKRKGGASQGERKTTTTTTRTAALPVATPTASTQSNTQPSKTTSKKALQGWKVKSLLHHRYIPNGRIQIKSLTANGSFVIRKGSNICSQQQFYTEMEVVG